MNGVQFQRCDDKLFAYLFGYLTGPRACYDEAKRVSETLAYSYEKQEKIEVRVARIFNTYGPRMHMNDGRVVSNFILQALTGQDITVGSCLLYEIYVLVVVISLHIVKQVTGEREKVAIYFVT